MSSPLAPTDWFTHDRFGLFIHWGTYALRARGEWTKKHDRIEEETYQRYFDHFDPDLYDPAKWARLARQAGMRYVVLTTKHHEGFCLWDTAHTHYKATNTPHGRDLLTPFVEAFRAEGLKIGFYYSLLDWHHPDYTIDRMHPRSPRVSDPETFATLNQNRSMPRYAEYMRKQVRELLTQFGEISLLWFDFSFPAGWDMNDVPAYDVGHGPGSGKGRQDWESEKLRALVTELQPNCLVNNRLDLPGEGDFVTPEQVQPASAPVGEDGQPVRWEACQTFSGAWGYERDAQNWKTPETLLWMLIDGVSKGGNLLLNVGPNGRGEIEPRAVERLTYLGDWMRLHERSIRGCGAAPAALTPPPDCRYTYNAEINRLYVHLFAWPFIDLLLPAMAGKIAYAQLLNDASELEISTQSAGYHNNVPLAKGAALLKLPVEKPPVTVPVIELYLKDE